MARERLQMRKKLLHERKNELGQNMSAVEEARSWAEYLVSQESRGNGDTENAMRRLETRWGVPWRAFWSLRYRPPKDILMGTYYGLRNAYAAEKERQYKRLRSELQAAKAAGVTGDLIDEASALLRADEEGQG